MSRRRALLRQLSRLLMFALLLAVVVMLVRYGRSVDWPAVGAALRAYGSGTLLAAVALAAASYLLYSGYDLAARRYAGHGLRAWQVVAAAFVSYAFNLNLGALVGGVGFRFRMYLRAGVGAGKVARVAAFSITTNWFGYALLAGGLLVLTPDAWAQPLHVPPLLLRGVGIVALALVAGYLVACLRGHGTVWRLRGHEYRLPSPRLALLQLALSTANWLTIASILYVLLGREIPYPAVLGTLLAGAAFAAFLHIPAGLGALEATFLTLLGDRMEQPALIAALLVYRAIYYLAPLLLAIVLYLGMEARGLARTARPHRD